MYLLSSKDSGLQNASSTTDKLRFRLSSYKENGSKALKGKEQIQPELFEHFTHGNHNCFLNDCSIALIDKRDSQDPTRREEHWEKGFENCCSSWVKCVRLMVAPARLYTFFWGESLVNVKFVFLFK